MSEEKVIGKIVGAKMTRTSGIETTIIFSTEDNICVDEYVDVMVDDKLHHFRIVEVGMSLGALHSTSIHVTAREVSYRKIANKSKFDIRNLKNLEVVYVTDLEKIKKIKEESTWC